MPALESRIVPQSDAYQQNHAALTELVDQLRTLENRTRDKSEASRARFEQRGQLLPRDRLGRLLDAGAPFLELSSLAGFCLDHADPTRSIPGGGFIAGIGWVSGVRAMIIVDDAGIDAGAVQPMGIEKFQRAQAIALEQKLPFIHLVESAGANLLTYRVETFIHGGSGFYWLARLSAAGIPVISVVHGSSTAGGAYMPGLSDYVVMVRDRARAFLAGPPLLKAATGEIATEEELGGAEMHATTSGLAEYLAEDDADALRIARELVAALGWNRDVPAADRTYAQPRFNAEELLGIALTDHRKPLDMREVIARIVDGSDFLEFKPDYGPGTVTGHAAICGMQVGIITNNGPLDPAGATKVVHFIQACCQSDTPLLYLQNTTGFIVGKQSEQAGMIKHGSKMIQAMANATVPRITVHCGASFGAGNYGMSGRGFFPDFCFSWPNAKTAVMGAEQAAGTMATVMAASMQRKTQTVDHEAIEAMRAKVIDTFERQSGAFTVSGRLLDDGVIDPRDTRKVLACVLAVCDEARRRTLHPIQFGVARP
ncbi:carboxyl transferase domain-containing protein [Ralstonia insidiosa]|jgi:geranyl-CoA carboxylase beta subunit|nr:carboxyl transferase domain-containing protein [Ralstonia insidiosa]KMW47248.1 acetyl-CoA carboxylase [Ralstonia sp. MD27]MBX3774891.1 acyl-CoA carboxylase subunit beta [Ralstonia pickettii]NOZ98405.1 acyl-CoA carboxylase subunit beta [Betaproteobacteria bacterium]MBA9858221.1 acyl-CoA carboxylase subunit beta [Ralstonia insidiosa]MBA9873045.1 acyl-CoA carboxylase subunit beta [Ralstonia insidiosa]